MRVETTSRAGLAGPMDQLQWSHAHVRVETLVWRVQKDFFDQLQWSHAHVRVETSARFRPRQSSLCFNGATRTCAWKRDRDNRLRQRLAASMEPRARARGNKILAAIIAPCSVLQWSHAHVRVETAPLPNPLNNALCRQLCERFSF